MTRAKFAPNPQQLLTDAAGPGNAYYAYYYEPDGTFSTQKTVYKDAAKSTSWTQPVTVGADGRPVGADVFLDGDYDRRVYDSDDNLIRSEQNIGDTWSAVGTDLSENLLSNASFETAGSGSEPFANWTATDSGSVITRDTTDSYHGVACALFTNSNNGSDYILSDLFEVSPGRDISLSFYVKASNASAVPLITISWHDKDQTFISSSTIYQSNSGLTPTSWDLVQGIRATPVSTARYATFALYGNNAATQYTTRFDGLHVSSLSRFPDNTPYKPFGLIISRDSGDTAHDIKITAGAVKSDDYANDIILDADIVKRLDATFAEGTANGGAASGFSLPADDVFAIWLMKNSTTGHVDVIADSSFTSPTLPSGYDVKRRIGAWLTDASNNLVDGIHRSDRFEFFEELQIVSDSTVTSGTFETGTAKAPPNAVLRYGIYVNTTSSDYAIELWGKVRPVGSDNTGGFGVDCKADSPANGTLDNVRGEGDVLLDSSQQFEYTAEVGSTSSFEVNINQIGWIDLERDDP